MHWLKTRETIEKEYYFMARLRLMYSLFWGTASELGLKGGGGFAVVDGT